MSFPEDLGPAHLFGNEARLMQRAFREGCRRYLEFGVGGSTLMAVRHGVETLVAVDSNLKWIETVRSHPDFSAGIARGTFQFVHAAIGPVGAWGYPTDPNTRAMWPGYVWAPWLIWDKRDQMPDLVFVDGRFRVACCLSVVVAAGDRLRGHRAPRVLIHDFTDARPQYRVILDFFDIIDRESTLLYLRPKRDASLRRALTLFISHQFEPGS
jgi:hypothetical protein